MKIRLSGTTDRVEAFAAVMRSAFRVREESRDHRDDPPSPNVRRYLHIDLRPVAKPAPADSAGTRPAPSPLSLATDAKHRRDLAGEIGILQAADADLKTQPWLPLQTGDVILVGYDSDDLGATYLADGDDTAEGPDLSLISATRGLGAQEWPVSLYELWFEAGQAALTVIRAGKVVFGRPCTVKAAGAGDCTAVGPRGARCELTAGHASSHMAHIAGGVAAWNTMAPLGEDEASSAAALAETRHEMDREAGDYGHDT